MARNPKSASLRLKLAGLSDPLEFVDCPELAEMLCGILRGWEPKRLAADDPRRPLVSFRRAEDGYDWVSETLPVPDYWQREKPADTLKTVCDIHYELTAWYLRERPGYLCLHGAAALFDGELVLFPSPGRAGKSTLTVALAMAGFRVYNDDVLPLEPEREHGVALGVLPRLRMPLPADADPALVAFMKEWGGPANEDWQYAALPDATFARFGETAPIKAIVFLERERGVPVSPHFVPIRDSYVLKEIIAQNFATSAPAMEIFDRLHRLMQKTERMQLRYSSAAAAVELLAKTFS